MKAWKKGAIVGAIWGILGIVTEEFIFPLERLSLLGFVLGIPYIFAVLLGFGYWMVFIGGGVFGTIIGSFIGFLFDLRKEKQRTWRIELKLSYWQKGAILGVLWSLIGFGLNFIFMKFRNELIALPDIIEAPIFYFVFIFNIPNILAVLWRIYILGPLMGFILGALGGYIYGIIKGGK
ncbi:hypothetical protein BMS3Abin16_01184 [archaeon BMS3Abin16]|nr:hypothetical protein BMS3Abin16_01184 [archaeon BMS3Abin16]